MTTTTNPRPAQEPRVRDMWGDTVPSDIASAIVCPDWCVSHDIDREALEGRDVYHYSPTFGEYVSYAMLCCSVDGTPREDQRLGVALAPGVGDHELYAADLRQLAAEALAAAEWMEAHR